MCQVMLVFHQCAHSETTGWISMKFEIYAFLCITHLHTKFEAKSVMLVSTPLSDLTWYGLQGSHAVWKVLKKY